MSLAMLLAPTVDQLVYLLQTAPGWCRVGLTAPTASLRAQATRELATSIATRLGEVPTEMDARQLPLPIA